MSSTNESIQRAETDSSPPADGSSTRAASGRSLAPAVRTPLEGAFGVDFSSVRVHTDDRTASDLNARAYTRGEHVHFAPGEYAPETVDGSRLVAHELTHVIQQRAGRASIPQGKDGLVDASSDLEREADRAADRVVRGRTPDVTGRTRASDRSIRAPPDGPIQGNWEGRRRFETASDADTQFAKDARIWYDTLTRRPENMTSQQLASAGVTSNEEVTTLQNQQRFLRRHFIAVALAQVDVGERAKRKGTYQGYRRPRTVPLAALVSHGGRFIYHPESSRIGDRLRTLLLTGSTRRQRSKHRALGMEKGWISGVSSHAARVRGGEVKEEKYGRGSGRPGGKAEQLRRKAELGLSPFRGRTARMPFPIGGLGTTGPSGYTIGPGGRMLDPTTGQPVPGLQHGASLFKRTDRGMLMVGFENSAFGRKSPIGGAHDEGAKPKDFSLTGGRKGHAYGIPDVGGLVSPTIGASDLRRIETAITRFERLGRDAQDRIVDEILTASVKDAKRILETNLGL
ncbi:MAG: DUF4157 domain-containing protein [Haloarculaceae archaeon]